jgi:hypothetical protein
LTAGNCVIAANQAGNANYAAAPQATQTIAVGAGAQNISFSPAPSLAVGGTGTVTATGGASGNTVTFTSTTPSICTVTGSTVTVLTAGSCVIAANQAGNANYAAAAQATQTITISALGLDLLPGWNLLGNGQDQPMAVDALFADKAVVITVWKWDLNNRGWQFYSPSLSAQALQAYATSKNYAVLTQINPGEGFWVNLARPLALTMPGTASIYGVDFQEGRANALTSGWNLVSVGKTITPATFNAGLSLAPPAAGVVPINLTTLWAWDNLQSKWYFYSPNLESQGGTALFDYTAGKIYLDFATTGKTLGSGMGFWVNKP